MICHRCGNLMYYAPFGGRWYHYDLFTLCPVTWPCHVWYATRST